jgi:hypothetical protein
VVRRLEEGAMVVALGGSGLLGALGLGIEARDWDLTTDSAIDEVEARLVGFEVERFGPSGLHADHKLRVAGGAIEIICGFAIHAGQGIVRIPTAVHARALGVPLGSPEAWAVAYALLGRKEKSERLMKWLAAHGADARMIGRLRAEPLPTALQTALAALPHSRTRG